MENLPPGVAPVHNLAWQQHADKQPEEAARLTTAALEALQGRTVFLEFIKRRPGAPAHPLAGHYFIVPHSGERVFPLGCAGHYLCRMVVLPKGMKWPDYKATPRVQALARSHHRYCAVMQPDRWLANWLGRHCVDHKEEASVANGYWNDHWQKYLGPRLEGPIDVDKILREPPSREPRTGYPPGTRRGVSDTNLYLEAFDEAVDGPSEELTMCAPNLDVLPRLATSEDLYHTAKPHSATRTLEVDTDTAFTARA